MKYKSLWIVVLSSVWALSACSSSYDELKTYMRCGIAAEQLEQDKASKKIFEKMEQYVKENNIQGGARDAMYLGRSVREEFNFDGKGMEYQLYKLVKVYNSSECTELHEQKAISPMPLMYYLFYFFF